MQSMGSYQSFPNERGQNGSTRPVCVRGENNGRSNAAAAAAKSLQSCPTLCDPIDGSPPGFPSLGFSRQEHWSGLPWEKQ